MKKFIFGYFIIAALASCNITQSYYMPGTHQVPLFTEKNDYRLSGAASFGAYSTASEIQAAAAVTDKFAVTAGWQQFQNKISQEANGVRDDYWKSNSLGGAFGYYKDYKKYGILEIYAGFGYAKQHHYYAEDSSGIAFIFPVFYYFERGYADFTCTRFFIQPNYGFSFFDCIDAGISARISNLYFNRVQNHVHDDYQAFREVEKIRSSRSYLLFEPALTVRGGWKYVKLQLQISGVTQLNSPSLKMDDTVFSIGLNFSFARRYLR